MRRNIPVYRTKPSNIYESMNRNVAYKTLIFISQQLFEKKENRKKKLTKATKKQLQNKRNVENNK